MRCIGIATFSRAEYSSCRAILRAIADDPELTFHLIVGGSHLSRELGYSISEIEADGFPIADRIEMPLHSDTPECVATSIGLGTIALARCFARCAPDVLLVVGDRTELLALASAAVPFRIPIAHVSGGDITEGSIDNQVRHAMTKMSALHFTTTTESSYRILQMGEEPWRVSVTGNPALDLIREMQFLPRRKLEERLGIRLNSPLVLVTLHPATLGAVSVADEAEALRKALEDVAGTLIISSSNADEGGRLVMDRLHRLAKTHPRAKVFPNLGQHVYYSLLAIADLMVGNSSSGIWEAPSFRLPVVNVGERQKGRLRAANVIDAKPEAEDIRRGLNVALGADFRRSLANLTNPYGDGFAAQRIVSRLKTVELTPSLLKKPFVDL
ncbi:UDP-N-acetylglucosamine 2-epimerase [Thermodesulfobacteriota bacterium]